ncbi:PH domain-containing protein [Erythrobacter sp. KMU-140]|uniref:PH domain-containing protein n=1 Tax=Erythrobacter rubeus TaxID=2760803 RepID=A0ABR8KTQ4_9SPHN|nr:PH domain-containing protein [Erythrobacter rubeus]
MTAKAPDAQPQPEPQRTAPLSVGIGLLGAIQNAIVPIAFVAFSSSGRGYGILAALGVGLAIIVIGGFFSYLRWRRLTYTIGAQDIRVESGVLSRAARSVPYERIQDVSLEQKLLPRLFGLVAVKFETGAGGGDDLSLAYLTEDAGEELRQLIRERRDAQAGADSGTESDAPSLSEEPAAEALFTMGPDRLFTFGLFEFSLAVFAVLAGLAQYADGFIEIGDAIDLAGAWFSDRGEEVAALGATLQILSALAGLFIVFIVGSATGMIRVFTREWGFLLERTARGFRRRRGLFTRTDVVMPIHRVQGVTIGTRALRYRFGWHNLRFVSLAQDAGSSSHVVAPFAKMEEIRPIIAAAGFDLPSDNAEWHRASKRYRTDSAIVDSLVFIITAIVTGTATLLYAPEWFLFVVSIPLVLALIAAGANLLAWRFQRHALDASQIVSTKGVLSPRSQIATRLKLHSAEIAQGPIARLRGYGTVHLGLAGGEFAIPGVPLDRAREVRREVLKTIAATDFSDIETS